MESVEATAARAIPYPTAQREAARDAIARYLTMLKSWMQTRFGVVGDGAGNVNVGDRTNFVYARLGDANGEVCEARNILMLDMAEGDPVLLARERPGGLCGWLVVEWYGSGTPPTVICSALTCYAQLKLVDFVSGAFAWQDSSVCVKGEYAYAVIPSQRNGSFLTTAQLLTIHLPTASIVSTVDIGENLKVVNINVARNSNFLWITGEDGSTPSVDGPVAERCFRYDITNPAAPSFDASGNIYLDHVWNLYEAGGAVYLVGLGRNYVVATATTYYAPLNVVDGSTLTTVGSYGPTAQNNMGNINRQSPLLVGDVVVVDLTTTAPGTVELVGVDLSTPSTPALLWSDSGNFYPLVTLDAATFYASNTSDSNEYKFDLTNPASPVKTNLGNIAVFGVPQVHRVLGDIDYVTPPDFGSGDVNRAATFSLADPDAPTLLNDNTCDSSVSARNGTFGARIGDADETGIGQVWAATIGNCYSGAGCTTQSIWLTIFRGT